MKNVFRGIFSAAWRALVDFFSSDIDVISNDAKRILADDVNADIYLKGLEDLRKKESEGDPHPKVTIILKNKEELTLSR